MTEDMKNLVLEHLTAMRASLARREENDAFINARLSSIEKHIAGVHAGMATMISRMDSMGKCLDRIERRLDVSSV